MTAAQQPIDHVPRLAEVDRLRKRLDRAQRARHQAERIAERVTRELYDRQQDVALLEAVARGANESSDVEDVLVLATRRVCAHTSWPVGHVYLTDESGDLTPTTIWHLDHPDRFETFRRVTEATRFVVGEGLPGRVAASAGPIWLPDVTVDLNFPRLQLAADIGVRGAFGFPILVGTDVVGVMEFFTDRIVAPDDQLLEVMAQIGTQLGRAIERDRARAAEERLNRELAARAAALESSNAELEQFASVASHDLQEPLRKVRTFASRVEELDADRLSEQGRDYLQRANSAAGRMQELIDDLLKLSRVTTLTRDFALVDLDDVMRRVAIDLEVAIHDASANVRIDGLPAVDADPLQMRQLLQNLLSNAVKFRREGIAPEIHVSSHVHREVAEILIDDNGIGFDPQYARRIFGVCERLHSRADYPGTGIGLALCRKIAERHGGSIIAEGKPGIGSRFKVTLPMRHDLDPASADPDRGFRDNSNESGSTT